MWDLRRTEWFQHLISALLHGTSNRERQRKPCKTLFINTSQILKMYKGRKEKKKKEGENLKDVKLAPTRCQNLSISTIDRLY
jgi:hypothetical protein